jgi:hypothetical protein
VKSSLPLVLALAAAPSLASGQAGAPPPGAVPLGFVVQVGLGAGGALGGGSEYARKSVFEGEVALGWEAGSGLRPELALALGVAPRGNLALRPGLRWSPPDLPFYVRGALDWSTLRSGAWRWVLAGAGAEVRLTDVLGAFGEADVGVPVARGVGLGLLVRAGVSFRF